MKIERAIKGLAVFIIGGIVFMILNCLTAIIFSFDPKIIIRYYPILGIPLVITLFSKNVKITITKQIILFFLSIILYVILLNIIFNVLKIFN